MRPGPFALTLAMLLMAAVCVADEVDPYLWLEDVEGAKALEWVKQRSKTDTAELEAVPQFAPIHEKLLKVYNSKDRIPMPSVQGPWVYNFWQDQEHVRGIWRRTTRDSYVTDAPRWETVIDLDQLAKAESENWVWGGANGLPPKYDRFMVTLSRGGGDASVIREFDATAKTFVKDGFHVPEAKSDVSWKDENTIWLGTNFGEGSLTRSGYPRFAKMWKRGTPLASATTVFECPVDHVAATAYSIHTPEGRYDIVNDTPEFFRGSNYIMRDDKLVKLEMPEDADFRGIFKKHILLSLRTDWTAGGRTYPQDALIAIDVDAFINGGRDFTILFKPEERVALGSVSSTRNYLLVTTLDNVKSRLYRHTLSGKDWKSGEVALPGLGVAGVTGASDEDDVFYVSYNDFLTPSSLYIVRDGKKLEKIKSTPTQFDATGMKVAQYEAPSKDGTKVPYFVFMPRTFTAGQPYPTLLYGYGGFEVSMLPNYSATIGSSWVERGGVYVLANIRGGGEFGPRWHQAAMKEKHQNAFDDFIGVAEDLIKRKITTPQHLGIAGGSNGGLLVGGCFTQRPELFNAVVCQVPLLDMKRYSHLLAGNSWMAEYGDPDTDDWSYMQKWSPYQNLDANKTYPKVFFYTSTRDDRVHPGHARKMVMKMTEMNKPVYYYENTEGGHSAGANLNQSAYMWALTYAYLWKTLGVAPTP
jgi:prolyl oligopeptidase